MKKTCIISILFFSLLHSVQAQSHSWDGNGLSPTSKMRTLNIFANIIFDVDSTMDPVEDSPYWHKITDSAQAGVNVANTFPSYLLDYMDTVYVPGQTHGTITRIFGESSFDSLQITGDFVVVNLLQSRMYQRFGQGSVFSFENILDLCLEMINATGGLSTIYGHNRRSDYAYNGTDLYFSLLYVRNTSRALGGENQGSGYGNFYSKYIRIENDSVQFSSKGAVQCVGSSNFGLNPSGVATHEIGHSLFGGNNFHTSGGNHRGSTETMPWMNIQGGYGLMGAAGSGLVSCNGYERWRMHWKHPSAPYYIYARDLVNIGFVNSDIAKEDGNKNFTLRDFVTYGDAVRIKLPYKDSTITPNQYIWLEFHNVGNNDKLDFLQFTNDPDICLNQGAPGIYAYYQIGRDTLEGAQVWDNINRDNLRIISNEGYWDYSQYLLPSDTDYVCTGWTRDAFYYVPEYSNAFCGYQDQETFIVPKWYDTDLASTCDTFYPVPFREDNYSLIYKIREYTVRNMIKNGVPERHNIMFNGDTLDAFSSHRKLNMGTNPSSCNAKTCYTYNLSAKNHLLFNKNSQYKDTTTYLTGLSIEMYPAVNGTLWRVKVRWDDYDIVNDARWTGKIVLKGTEQVNLTRGNSITLAQNRTPAQRYRNMESGYFADPTKLTCEAGSIFTQQPQSSLILTEKSRFVLDSGATYHLGDSAQILVQGNSTFTITRGADFTGGVGSEIIVDSLSTLYVYDTAKLRREARIIVRPGGTLVVDGGTLTNACEGEIREELKTEK